MTPKQAVRVGVLLAAVLGGVFSEAQAQSIRAEGTFAVPNATLGGSLGAYLELGQLEGWGLALRSRAHAGLSLLGLSPQGSGWDLGVDALLVSPQVSLGQVYGGISWGYGFDEGGNVFSGLPRPREGAAWGWVLGWAGACSNQRQTLADLTVREARGAEERSFVSLNIGVRVGC